jgi:hypothetical protein
MSDSSDVVSLDRRLQKLERLVLGKDSEKNPPEPKVSKRLCH